MTKPVKKELPRTYIPSAIEQEVYAFWEEGGYFHAQKTSDKPPFCIVLLYLRAKNQALSLPPRFEKKREIKI